MAPRLFGTNGVRGIVNEGITAEFALRLGKAIGRFMSGNVAIGSDTRTSADMVKYAVASGIMASGQRVLDLGVLPTPALQYFVKTHNRVSGGVMITASHNPPEFNGIKCVDSDGTEMHRSNEERIEENFAEDSPGVPWDAVGSYEKVSGASESYVNAIVSKVDAAKIRAANLTVALDVANGAAYKTAPLLLKKLNVRAVTLNANPQGEFPGHPSEPTEGNLSDLIRLTKSLKADLGVAHDGDADRAVFVTRKGEYVSGDKSLALLASYALDDGPGTVVTPVSTSSVVEEVVRGKDGDVVYTAVGSPIVARKMMEIGAAFGGEENGGLIFPEMQYCRDAGMTLAKMLEFVAVKGPLHAQIEKLPVYYVEKAKIDCPDHLKDGLMEAMLALEPDRESDTTDGVKFIFKEGWVLMRPSGTEPIFRIYTESKDKEWAVSKCAEYVEKAKAFVTQNSL
ncbi:MAG: phosphoglucosamine mutase [Thermoplasmatales archaeon]|nr:phosphoglucosamine mutase [Thermoplasmatales archaeon]